MKKITEDEQVKTFFKFIRFNFPELSKMATHIKNEGKRSYSQVSKDKSMGMTTGYPDIIILGNPCLVIEMKTQTGKLSAKQKEWIDNSNKFGIKTNVCYSAEEAIKVFLKWVRDNKLCS